MPSEGSLLPSPIKADKTAIVRCEEGGDDVKSRNRFSPKKSPFIQESDQNPCQDPQYI